jgi:hypothetical protein
MKSSGLGEAGEGFIGQSPPGETNSVLGHVGEASGRGYRANCGGDL